MSDLEIRELERQAQHDPRARRRLDSLKARLDPDRLGSDQERVLEAVEKGETVFQTGAPGSGKSTVISKLVERFPKRRIAITASTALAGLRIGGTTLHRFARIMPDDSQAVLAAKPQNPQEWAQAMDRQVRVVNYRAEHIEDNQFSVRLGRVDLLCLDEVSMTDAVTFELAMRTIAYARGGKPLPLLLSGDFAQLLPVGGRDGGLAFEAPAWEAAKPRLIELKEAYRSITDPRLTAMLVAMRDGIVSDRTVEILKSLHGTFDPDEEEGVARIVCKKDEARKINDDRLAELPGSPVSYAAVDSGDKALLRECLSPDPLLLKVGAKVMFTKNAYDADGRRYVNGMIGEVTHASHSGISVSVDGENYNVTEREAWQSWGLTEWGERTILAERHQFPLALAYAITTHRAQGSTFDKVSCDLSSAWEFGHVYVALSRARRLADLNIESMPVQSIDMDPKILPWLHEAAS